MDLIEIGLAQSERLLDDSFDAAWSATAAVKSNQRPQASHHFGCSFDCATAFFAVSATDASSVFRERIASSTNRV
jgi:hypothetical protein